jgi:3-hydroxyisobutyrate dehydrogenase
MDTKPSIGWIGTGVMGEPIAGHLLNAGYRLTVYTRTRARAESLLQHGAQWADSPADLARETDVVITMLGHPEDVRQVLREEGRVLETMQPGSLLIDMTTSEPSLAREIYSEAKTLGIDALDAPVSGGDVGARNATLVIMVGGDPEALDRAMPILEVVGKTVRRQGGPGAGQHTKMVNQLAIASGMIGVCEALVYAYRAGLDVAETLDTIKDGAAGSWSLTNYGSRLLRDDLEPGFKVDHFIKDLGIALSEAKRMNISLPGAALAEQLYIGVRSRGLGQKGTQALAIVIGELAQSDWPSARLQAAAGER